MVLRSRDAQTKCGLLDQQRFHHPEHGDVDARAQLQTIHQVPQRIHVHTAQSITLRHTCAGLRAGKQPELGL